MKEKKIIKKKLKIIKIKIKTSRKIIKIIMNTCKNN